MPFYVNVNLGTVGLSVLRVKLSTCTSSDMNSCTVLSGYENRLKSDYPLTMLVPDGTLFLKLEASDINGGLCVMENIKQMITVPATPTPTPLPTATPTATPTVTPTATPTVTPTPTVTSTPTVTPTPTVNTPTPTPTVTSTPTVTPTPTNTPNITIDPSYFYYAMGSCSDMKYTYTASTITGFSAPIRVPGCATLAEIGTMSLQNPATTSYELSNPLVACGFGTGYTSTIIARSSTSILNETVFNIGGQCLAVIAVDTQYVSGTTIDLSGVTPIGIGYDACNSCSPPFTGFTISGYSGVTCDTGENVIAYSLLGGFTLGNVYGIQMYSGGTATGDRICMTLNTNLGPQFVIEDPETEGISGYQISDAGPATFPPTFSGYTDCDACDGVVQKYMITGDRCDTTGSVTIWSNAIPAVVSGDTISVNIGGTGTIACFLVTQADQFTSVVYNDIGSTIIDTGCDCNGNSGGASVNVDNIVFSPTVIANTGGECQSGGYYNEATISEMELTFKDSGNNPVTPNSAVQYRVNGGSWQTLTVTSSTKIFLVTLTYGDSSACTGGGSVYADTLDVQVGTKPVITYTAGSS